MATGSKLSFLGASPLLSRLPPMLLGRAVRHTTPVRLPRRRALWHAGAPVEHVYFVRSGVARVGRVVEEGPGLIYSFHAKGHVFGEVEGLLAAMEGALHHHTDAQAHEDLLVYALPIAELRKMIDGSPEVGLELAMLLARRRRRIEARMAGLLFRPVRARLAAALQELASEFGVRDSRGVIINLRLTQGELASFVGAARQTVSRRVSVWRREGLLTVEHRRIVLLRPESLARQAEAAD